MMPVTVEREQVQDLTQALFGGATETPSPATPPVVPPLTRRTWLYAAGVLIIVLTAVALVLGNKSTPAAWGTAQVRRTDLSKTVSATGRLQALMTVQVGTQVSGTISELYVDYNSQVKKGQVIARLDPSQLQAQLTQANANLAGAQASAQAAQSNVASAEAGVQSAEANLQRMDSVVADAQLTVDRTSELIQAGVTPRRDLDPANAALTQASAQRQQGIAQLNQARAQAQSARSQLQQSRAQVAQATASVQLASVNLQKTVIQAPIDGTVVSRSVDVGQTVAASLQAPTLFMIANDLTRMQVLADIDEADVGQLKPQDRVTFTVDAYPSETFEGTISQIRLSPQTLQNVVTYTAVIDVANPDLKLKPGMTASVSVITAERPNALTVPNAALRFRPEGAAAKPPRAGSGTLYRIQGTSLEPVKIQPGLTDGVATEILAGDLREGDRIAVPAAQNTGTKTSAPAARRGMMGGRIR